MQYNILNLMNITPILNGYRYMIYTYFYSKVLHVRIRPKHDKDIET